YGCHKRSLSETAMYRVKQLLGGRLSLRNYNAQVGETYAIIKALNKITGLGMPKNLPYWLTISLSRATRLRKRITQQSRVG
ncbi:TPA: IS5/IS1182 family transposase, partial [Vibrio cholerae]|nr:IS5/IS1182 family transposase [Vibrio cholerae]